MHESKQPGQIQNASSLVACVDRIGEDIARASADQVDRLGRFPSETIAALKRVGALSAGVPKELGGAGCSVEQLASICTTLGRHCSASAMIVAMHYIQVACIVNHCGSHDHFRKYLADLVSNQRLIASVTSEVGTDGELRRSKEWICNGDDEHFTFTKLATTISYGEFADDLLVTLRRSEEASANDQVLVLVLEGDYHLELTTPWDTLGMRGTCSPGAIVIASGNKWQIFEAPFSEVAEHSMVPVAHVVWSAVWLGIAIDAVAIARQVVQRKARTSPSVVPQRAESLAVLDSKLQLMRADLTTIVRDYVELLEKWPEIDGFNIGFSLRLNNLKLNASRFVREIVMDAMEISGMTAYRNDSEFSLGRHLRDALSASLMISNGRIQSANAALQLVHKGK